MNSCPYCLKEFSNPGGLGAHHPYCKLNPNRIPRPRNYKSDRKAGVKLGNVAWNKGLKGDPRCLRPNSKGIHFGSSLYGHSESTKQKLSKIAKTKGLGGYNERSGRGKKGRYKGIWCDSSWELAWVIYQLEHRIPFTRNTQKFPYTFEGKTRNWIPDFILSDGTYVEIKGYETDLSQAKRAEFPYPIIVLKEKDLTPILEFVKLKFGRDFIRLYEEGAEVGSSSSLENCGD